jgi:glutaredoxin 2
MKFIMRKDIPTLQKKESAICVDSLSIITHTKYEGLKELSLKNFEAIPVKTLQEITDFLNEAHSGSGGSGDFENIVIDGGEF